MAIYLGELESLARAIRDPQNAGVVDGHCRVRVDLVLSMIERIGDLDYCCRGLDRALEVIGETVGMCDSDDIRVTIRDCRSNAAAVLQANGSGIRSPKEGA